MIGIPNFCKTKFLYSSSDSLSNLLVLVLRILYSGISDSRLLVHLVEVTVSSLKSVRYEERAMYKQPDDTVSFPLPPEISRSFQSSSPIALDGNNIYIDVRTEKQSWLPFIIYLLSRPSTITQLHAVPTLIDEYSMRVLKVFYQYFSNPRNRLQSVTF